MLKIRRSCFETNSSSMHAIILLSNEQKKVETYDGSWRCSYDREKGILTIHDNSFERGPFQILYAWPNKLAYAIADYYVTDAGQDEDEIKAYIKELIAAINDKGIYLKEIELPYEGYYCEDTQCYEKELDYGWVDHQSMGTLADFLEENDISVADFITDPHCAIVIDGDETQVFKSLAQLGLINTNNIKRIKGQTLTRP